MVAERVLHIIAVDVGKKTSVKFTKSVKVTTTSRASSDEREFPLQLNKEQTTYIGCLPREK